MMKYLSVCSGIEAASVAWHPLGWKPLAFSEIEPFPCAVLAHHYPDVPCHGDFTKLRDEPWIVDADILVGGTPCQAFSVAGLRNSLSDNRGNLTLEYVRLANAIDNLRNSAGKEPAILVWENVPGVLSVKDNAFGSFLAGLAGEDVPLEPPGGKWKDAGCVIGPQRTVAWRTLDAQYFGLAQRRRRVFVVASARKGFDPAAVLLEFEGVRRDTPPRREKGQAASGGATGCAGGGGVTEQLSDSLTVGANQTTGFSSPSVVGYSHWDDPNAPHPTLNQSHNTGAIGYSNQELFSQRGAGLVGEALTGEISHCLNAGGMGRQDYETETLVTHALRGEGFDGSEDGTGRETPLVPVAQPLPFDTTQITSASNYSRPQPGDPCHPLAAGAHPPAIAFHPTQDPIISTDGSTHALGCGSKGGQASVAVAFGGDVARTLSARHDSSPCADRGMDVVATQMAVRRLTPTECERLQGFPDNYTLIPWKKKPAADCPDGPRYKALGNSMAVPCMAWIGQRIARAVA